MPLFSRFPQADDWKGEICGKWEEWHSCGERIGDRMLAEGRGWNPPFLAGQTDGQQWRRDVTGAVPYR
ncbi:MAG: hypothetical protein DRJ65_11260 [Acidobacteria bacterium]|nr:MAG: hypothetical protein DRJ65_11260 [Acidobacteriota bacterium]